MSVRDVCSVIHFFCSKSEFLSMRNIESTSIFMLCILTAVEVKL